MKLSTTEFNYFSTVHDILNEVKHFELNEWKTLNIPLRDGDMTFLPSPDSQVKALFEEVGGLLEELNDLLPLLESYDEYSTRLTNLRQKMFYLKTETCNIKMLSVLKTAWFDFGLFAHMVNEIYLVELERNSDMSQTEFVELADASIEHNREQIYCAVEFMKLAEICYEKELMERDTLH